MKLRAILLALAVLFTFFACNSNGPGDSIDHAYQYIAQNANNDTNAARGSLELRFMNTDKQGFTTKIEGKWKIDKLNDADEIGPQTGEGELQGVVKEDGSFRIDLNPNIADQNVILTGSFSNGDRSLLEGQWTYQTQSGSSSGEFEASQVGPIE